MSAGITVTAEDVEQFRARSGNPHMVRVGRHVRIYGEDYYRMYRSADWHLIVTRADLNAVDPDTEDYTPEGLAELLTNFADNMVG